jgi:hypothetical protein
MNILQAIDDRNLFGSALRDPVTWSAWRAFLAALFGLPLLRPSERSIAIVRVA